MQLFVLAFNSGISYETAKERAEQYDLPVLFAYEVYNGEYRIGFLNDASIKYAKVAEIMIEALLTIFPEADPLSRDLTSIFLGGKKVLHFDEAVPTINIDLLIRNMCLYLKYRYGEKNYRRKIYGFSDLTGLALNESKMFDVSVREVLENEDHKRDETLSPISLLYIIEDGGNSSKRSKVSYRIRVKNETNADNQKIINHSSSEKKEPKIHLPYSSSDLREIRSSCQLYREFEDGARRLNKDELSGVAGNLIQVESGSSRFMEIFRTHAYFNDKPKKYSDWDFHLHYMKKMNSEASSCDWYCPYCDHCHHARDILSTAKPKHHTTQILANYKEPLYHIGEARKDFKEKLDIAIKADDERIHAINAPIAIGKSTVIRDLMEKNDLRILISLPDNDLKNESYEKAIARGIKAVKSPSLIESKDKLPTKVWKHIEYLYRIGKPFAVTHYINSNR